MQARAYKITLSIVAVLLLVVAVTSALFFNEKEAVAIELENQYQRDFYALVDDCDNINLLLGKYRLSSSNSRILLLAEIAARADNISGILSSLPLSDISIERSQQYYNQLKDYSLTVADSISRGDEPPAEAAAVFADFYKQLTELQNYLQDLVDAAEGGHLSFRDGGTDSEDPLGAFNRLETALNDIELLSYDGEYSAKKKELAAALKDLPEVSEQEARKIAKEFLHKLGIEKSETGVENVCEAGDKECLGVYLFSYDGDEPIALSVSRQGGLVVSYYLSRTPSAPVLSIDQGKQRGAAYAELLGYDNFEIASARQTGGELSLVLVRTEDEVVYYPDSLQISVAMDSGELMAFNATEYLKNFNKRDLDLSVFEKEEKVSFTEGFAAGKSRPAVICNKAGNELLCREYAGDLEGESYVVYLNSDGGDEEGIFRRMDGDNGFYNR